MSGAVYSDVSICLLHAGIYRSLAVAFACPGLDSVAALTESWANLVEWKKGWPDGVRESFGDAMETLRTEDVPWLAEEYVRLFGPAARCPLTETSWGDSARLLGKAAHIADISGFYRAFNLQPGEGTNSVPEDHLEMELEYMSVLCLKEAYALNNGLNHQLEITRDAQKKFLEHHLATWIDCWAESLQENAPTPFFRTLAATLQRLIHADVQRLVVKPLTIRARLADREVGAESFECPLGAKP